MPRSVAPLILQDADEARIQQWLSAFGTPQQVALRSRIVLASAAGESDSAIAERLDTNRKTVTLWRTRFAQEGLESLWEVAPGRGRKPTYGNDKIQEIIDTTLQTKPKGMTQWSCRLLAAQLGVSKSTVNTVWRSHNLKPHRVKTFKLSRDPRFLEKLTDVVGLYLNPPQQAIILCVDERFPGEVPLHLVMDNYGTHGHEKVRGWLKRHPRFVLHFVPTSSSWLNLVERWFGELTSKRIRRGAFFSVGDLEKAIEEFLQTWNEKPRPFVWTATVESIVEKLSRCPKPWRRLSRDAPHPGHESRRNDCPANSR